MSRSSPRASGEEGLAELKLLCTTPVTVKSRSVLHNSPNHGPVFSASWIDEWHMHGFDSFDDAGVDRATYPIQPRSNGKGTGTDGTDPVMEIDAVTQASGGVGAARP